MKCKRNLSKDPGWEIVASCGMWEQEGVKGAEGGTPEGSPESCPVSSGIPV